MQLLRGVLAIWRSIAADGELEEVFGDSRGRSYEKALKFAELVRLFADAISHHSGSGRQAMLRAKEEGRLSVSQQAAYGKLRRVPPEVSQKLVEHCTLRMREMVPESMEPTLPASLRGYAGVTMDGKTLKELAKRLLATRQAKGGLLGGRVLAALDMRTNQIVCIQADQDGYANEAPLLEPLLPRGRGYTCWTASSASSTISGNSRKRSKTRTWSGAARAATLSPARAPPSPAAPMVAARSRTGADTCAPPRTRLRCG